MEINTKHRENAAKLIFIPSDSNTIPASCFVIDTLSGIANEHRLWENAYRFICANVTFYHEIAINSTVIALSCVLANNVKRFQMQF